MFSETAYSRQAKSIGQSLPTLEHTRGYSNLALAATKDHKGLYLVLNSWMSRNSELEHKFEKVSHKESFRIVNFYLAFMGNKGQKG